MMNEGEQEEVTGQVAGMLCWISLLPGRHRRLFPNGGEIFYLIPAQISNQ
jgi:hypothetical protein